VPTNIKIIHASEFIKATLEGKLDFEESKRGLQEIASAAGPLADCEIILDTRKAEVVMSPSDLWYLAAEFGKLRENLQRRIAVLCPLEHFDQAEFFALCAQNRGFSVRTFTSFEDAINWLTSSTDKVPRKNGVNKTGPSQSIQSGRCCLEMLK
jgi:hypothetical protein